MKNHMRVVWASFALLVALFIAVPTWAAPVFKGRASDGSQVALTLYETPCKHKEVLKYINENVQPSLRDKFLEAKLFWQGKEWSSCWIVMGGIVYSVDEEGAPLQPIPMEAFREQAI